METAEQLDQLAKHISVRLRKAHIEKRQHRSHDLMVSAGRCMLDAATLLYQSGHTSFWVWAEQHLPKHSRADLEYCLRLIGIDAEEQRKQEEAKARSDSAEEAAWIDPYNWRRARHTSSLYRFVGDYRLVVFEQGNAWVCGVYADLRIAETPRFSARYETRDEAIRASWRAAKRLREQMQAQDSEPPF